MSLAEVLLEVGVVVGLLHLVSLLAVVGVDDLRTARRTAPSTLRAAAVPLGGLAAVLAVNGVVRRVGAELSWLVGVNVTGVIFAIEGSFVAALQSHATPAATAYFGFVYVFGYVYLLTFPVLSAALRADPRTLRTLAVAYGVNYGVGLACYVAFIAYGPRNLMPDLVDSLLFANWPRSQLLTSRVNENTNVFPPLHTSLSVTVALVAYRARDRYPRWTPVAVALAASVVVSTMYLGIHWATDVVAGAVLAVGSVVAADRYERRRGADRRGDSGRSGESPEPGGSTERTRG